MAQLKSQPADGKTLAALYENYGVIAGEDSVQWKKTAAIRSLEGMGMGTPAEAFTAIKSAADAKDSRGIAMISTNPSLVIVRTERGPSFFSTNMPSPEWNKLGKMLVDEYSRRGEWRLTNHVIYNDFRY